MIVTNLPAIGRKINKRADRLRFQPLEVFVIHAVTDTYNPEAYLREDWMQTEIFVQTIKRLKRDYTFIPLTEAYGHLRHDWLRRRRYAVLTCDDGFASVQGILPFLESEKVPITLFINPRYLDGKSRREGYAPSVEYLTEAQLAGLTSHLVSIGMHGYEHLDATKQSEEEFGRSVTLCTEMLGKHPRYIPYFAYTWGRNNATTERVLKRMGVVPVLCDGASNYRYRGAISRRLLPEEENK